MFVDKDLKGWRCFVNVGYRRYRVAAALNFLGIKLENAAHYFFAFLSVKLASFINPKYNDHLESVRKLKRNVVIAAPVLSVKQWCERHGLSVSVVSSHEVVFIKKPYFVNEQSKNKNFAEGEAVLPDAYLAELTNVAVVGGTDLVLSNSRYALYDELANAGERCCGNRSSVVIENKKNKKVVVRYLKARKIYQDPVIHFCKDHSLNYFHWLIECLPRLWIVDQFAELKSLPLLIDANLFPQQLEALHLLNEKKRELIVLKRGMAYHCKKVFYPSALSVMHDNYDLPISFNEDIFYSPLAIAYVRNFFLEKLSVKSKLSKKFFVVRKSALRALVNTEEIQAFLASKGFETVFPEKMSFVEQVTVFSQAEIIVGQSGAGMANIIFAPQGAKVIMFMNDHPKANYYIFKQLGDLCGLNFCYILGRNVVVRKCYEMHNDFEVDLEILKRAFE